MLHSRSKRYERLLESETFFFLPDASMIGALNIITLLRISFAYLLTNKQYPFCATNSWVQAELVLGTSLHFSELVYRYFEFRWKAIEYMINISTMNNFLKVKHSSSFLMQAGLVLGTSLHFSELRLCISVIINKLLLRQIVYLLTNKQ